MIPTCPKCGCPARNVVLIKARVRCVLNDDGTAGKVLSASREEAAEVMYECGGVAHRACQPFKAP